MIADRLRKIHTCIIYARVILSTHADTPRFSAQDCSLQAVLGEGPWKPARQIFTFAVSASTLEAADGESRPTDVGRASTPADAAAPSSVVAVGEIHAAVGVALAEAAAVPNAACDPAHVPAATQLEAVLQSPDRAVAQEQRAAKS